MKSTTLTVGVGTRKDMPVSLPLTSGMARPTALAAPVPDGMMFTAAALALARRQGADLFELRAAVDDFELRGQPARAALIALVSRFPTNSAWPELARAQALLQ